MAKIIAFDGLSRSGKTTMAKEIASIYGCPYIAHEFSTLFVKSKSDYFAGYINGVYKMLEHYEGLVVMDRTYVSEMAFAKVFNRQVSFDAQQLGKMLTSPTLYFYCKSTHKDYIARGAEAKDGFRFSLSEWQTLTNTFNGYYMHYNKVPCLFTTMMLTSHKHTLTYNLKIVKDEAEKFISRNAKKTEKIYPTIHTTGWEFDE